MNLEDPFTRIQPEHTWKRLIWVISRLEAEHTLFFDLENMNYLRLIGVSAISDQIRLSFLRQGDH